jgi:hypothetical protein
MSANAPEFVPLLAKAPTRPSKAVSEVPAEDSLVFAEDYVSFLEDQQRRCVLKKAAPAVQPHSRSEKPPSVMEPKMPEDVPSEIIIDERSSLNAGVLSCKAFVEETTCKTPNALDDDAENLQSSDELESQSAMGDDVSAQDLPSVGSALHASGECRLCNFHRRGRCESGRDCTFCHLPHDKNKVKRLGKRERQAALIRLQKADADETGKDQESSQDVVSTKDLFDRVEQISKLEREIQKLESVGSVKDTVPYLAKGASLQQAKPLQSIDDVAAAQGLDLHAYAYHVDQGHSGVISLATAGEVIAASFINFDDYADSDDSDDEEGVSEVKPAVGVVCCEGAPDSFWSRDEMLRLRVSMRRSGSIDAAANERPIKSVPRLVERC